MTLPQEVKNIIEKLQEKGFEAYAVGGCVRDLLMDKKPKDWDITTNAIPEQIQKIFPDSFYENKFGTVTVKIQNSKFISSLASLDVSRSGQPSSWKEEDEGGVGNSDRTEEEISEVEVTTYRVDAKYTDKRHPDSVSFTGNLREDLARRDFTINALALDVKNVRHDGNVRDEGNQAKRSIKRSDLSNLTIIDPFCGQEDLKNKFIRAVGEPEERFSEDALRMMRAVRFAVVLDFKIEEKTKKAIQRNAAWLQAIAKERIRDELEKIIMSDRPDEGILLLHELGLLEYVVPELEKGVGVAQNRHHIFTIFEHNIESIKFAAQKKYNFVVRLAALLHDIAKPQAKRGEGPESTFYNHDLMGSRAAARILERLHFSREIIERVANLIRNHMFVYDIGAVTEAGVRRLLRRVGPENMEDLIALRVADRLGSGVPKAQPYRLRHFQYMVERVQYDAISVKMLKINGNDLMQILGIEPGPKIGAILDVLLAEVIEDPKLNTKDYLAERVGKLNEMDLSQLRQMAKEKIEEKKEEEDKIIKNKYWVE